MFRIKIKDEVFASLEDFGRNMYLYPEACENLLTSTKFLKALAEESRETFEKIVELNHQVRDVNAFLFHAQYVFCPHMELKHHRYSFTTLKELGEQILKFAPKIDIYLKDFLKFKLLSKYMRDQGIDIRRPELYSKVLELEKLFYKNENKAYFMLGFVLAETNNIVFEKKEYKDVKSFFQDMISDYYIINFSNNLESNQYVYAWLEVNNLNDEVRKYQALLETVEQLEVNKWKK